MAIVTLIEASPRDAAGNPHAVRLAGGGARGYDHKGFIDWLAGIADRPLRRAAIGYDADGWTGGSRPTTFEIVYSAADRSRLSMLAAMIWNGAPITVSIGDDANAAPTWTVISVGTVTGLEVSGADISIEITDLSAQLDVAAVPTTFAGTGGIEGAEAATGRTKRRSWGRVFNVEGRVLDPATNVYEFGDPSLPLQAFADVRDIGASGTGSQILAWQGSAAATLDALRGAAVTAGGGVYAPSIGCVRWWTQPQGPLTADLVAGAALAIGDVARAIIQAYPTAITVPAADVAALNAARPGDVGLHADEASDTIANLLDRLLLGASSLWTVDQAGALRLRPWTFDGATETLRCDRIGRLGELAPLGQRKVGFRRNYRVQSDGEISVAIAADAILYEDGQTLEDLKPADPGATKGAPSGTPLGSRTVDDVLSQLVDVDAAIAQLQQDVQDGTSPDLTDLRNDVNQAKSDLQSISQTVSSHTQQIGQNKAAVTSEVGARANADNALAGRIDTVSASVGDVNSRVSDEVLARSTADTALANRTSSVEAATRSGSPNLIVNGDFGDNQRGWTVDVGSWGVVGTFGIGPFVQAGGSASAHIYQDVVAQAGTAYSLSFEADPDNGTDGGFCYVEYLNASGSRTGYGANIRTDSWTRVSSTPFVAPSGTVKARVHLQKTATNAIFRATRIQLQQDAATSWAPDASLWSTAARVTTEESARATADSALATRATNIEATVYAPNSGVAAAHARISDEVTSRVSAVSAVSSQVNTLTASIATLSSPNLIANGSFANGLSGWTVFGGANFDVITQYTPIFAQSDENTGSIYTDVSNIQVGKNYCFGFESANDSGDNTGYMQVQWKNSSGGNIRFDSGPTTAGQGWDNRIASGPFVAPSGAVLARIVYYCRGSGTGNRRISRLQFQQSDSPTAYSDAASLQALQAQVTTNQAAIADISKNKLAAYWQVAATAGNQSASISAVAQAGGTTYSAIEIIASQFTVKTGGSSKPILGVSGSTVFINGSLVVTDSIVDNAVSVFATVNTGNTVFQGDGDDGNYTAPSGGGGYNGGSIP